MSRFDYFIEFWMIPVQFVKTGSKVEHYAAAFAAVIGLFGFKLLFGKREGFNYLPKDYRCGVNYQWLKLKLFMLLLLCWVTYLAACDRLPHMFPGFF